MGTKRVAVVTGGNKGIGFAIVRALCKQFDGDVYLTARDAGRGQNAVKELEGEGLKPKFHLLDYTDRKSVDALKDFLVQNYGGIDVFVHNAAIAFKVQDPTPFAQQATMSIATNYTCTVELGTAILLAMKANGRISIVASQAGTMSLSKCSSEVQSFFKSPDITEEQISKKLQEFVKAAQDGSHQKAGFSNSAYGMSKLGVIVYTRLLAKAAAKLDRANVLVNCCCPGYVSTDMSSYKGTLTPDQGAITPTMLAMIPPSDSAPNGEFLYQKKILKWC